MATERGFDTSQFFPGISMPSRGRTARSTASRRTATRWRWPTTRTCHGPGLQPPTNWDELKAAAAKLTTGNQKASA